MLSAIFLALLPALAIASPVPALEARANDNARFTYYYTDVGLGACGKWHGNNEWTVAMNSAQYGGGYPSAVCGQQITISYGGKTAVATIQDECPTCPYGGLDLSPSLFSYFADQSNGVITGSWSWGSNSYTAPAAAAPVSNGNSASSSGSGASWTARGCYQDSWSRILTGSHTQSTSMTRAKCQATCDSQGFNYYGVEYGVECHCGNLPSGVNGLPGSSSCNKPCSGNGGENCGGNWGLDIFQK